MDIVVEEVLSRLAKGVIFSGRKPDGSYVRVRAAGEACWPAQGEVYQVEGTERRYTDSRGFTWDQIDATRLDRVQTSGALILPWLQGLPNIGPDRARRLMEAFGNEIIGKLQDVNAVGAIAAAIDPVRPHLSHRIALSVVSAMNARAAEEAGCVAEARFLKRLEEYGVTDRQAARRLWRLIGSMEAEQRLLQKPYLAACVLPWKDADHLGQRLLAARTDVTDCHKHPERLVGAVTNAMQSLLAQGHTAAAEQTMIELLEARGVNARLALEAAEKALTIRKEGKLYRAPGAAWIEDTLADKLLDIAEQPEAACLPADLAPFIKAAELRTELALTDEQRWAVNALLRQPMGVLQGGAGVGKTTVTKIVAEVWEALGGNVVLGCFAGKAALQLSRGASTPARPRLAYTLKRMTDMVRKGHQMVEDGRETFIPPDWPRLDNRSLLVLDEASMIDTPTLHDIVMLMPPGARLLLVGDHGQLPPVGYGCVFHDLVEDGRFVQSLTQVLRQKTDSPIPYAAADIRNGIVPDLPPYKVPDYGIFLEVRRGREMHDAVRRIHDEWVSRQKTAGEVLVCAALRRTVTWFNQEMCWERGTAHPDLPEARLGPMAVVAAGDPVICTRNHYAHGLVNGLMGVVSDVAENGEVRILWDGDAEPRLLDPVIGGDIEPAYAITCHKAQGSAAKYIIVPLESTPFLTREWLYTAVTRATETVVLVGAKETLAEIIQRRTVRVTGFKLARHHTRTILPQA